MCRNKAFALLLALIFILSFTPALSAGEKTGTLELGEFVRTAQTTGSAYFPIQARLTYEGPTGIFQSITVKKGDRVAKGDVIATVLVEGSGADTQQALLSLDRAREDYRRGCEDYEERLIQAREAMYAQTDGYQREMARLSLQMLESQYAQYRFQTEAAISRQEENCEDLSAQDRIVEVTAPMDGVIEHTEIIRKESKVYDGQLFGTMFSLDAAYLAVPNGGGAFRYGQSVTITVGSGKNAAQLPGLVVAADNMIPQAYRSHTSYVAVDIDISSLDVDPLSLKGISVVCENQRLEGVPILPKALARMDAGKYAVNLWEDGMMKKRYVVLAGEATGVVWVLDGLHIGDTVISE